MRSQITLTLWLMKCVLPIVDVTMPRQQLILRPRPRPHPAAAPQDNSIQDTPTEPSFPLISSPHPSPPLTAPPNTLHLPHQA